MSRPTNLPEPWRSLALQLGGAGAVYAAIVAATGMCERSAKNLCRGGVASLRDWRIVEGILKAHGLSLFGE